MSGGYQQQYPPQQQYNPPPQQQYNPPQQQYAPPPQQQQYQAPVTTQNQYGGAEKIEIETNQPPKQTQQYNSNGMIDPTNQNVSQGFGQPQAPSSPDFDPIQGLDTAVQNQTPTAPTLLYKDGDNVP
eukprot:UN04275